MERGGRRDEAAHLNALVLEYLDWAGLEDVGRLLVSECHAKGLSISREAAESRASSGVSRIDTAVSEEFSEGDDDLLSHFDTGQGAKFFQAWRVIRARENGGPSMDSLTLEFYLHVYFSTLPLRHGHEQDHAAAMTVFRRFLDSCPQRLGSVQELLPFYGLPYVPDPTTHPAFASVFQDSWVRDLRARLKAWMDNRVSMTSRPALLSYVLKQRQHAKSVGAALVAQESAATAVRSQRTLRRRLQRLQDDYHKLIGVAWELTQGLEAAVRGERVDLEATLAACTHRYPELFTLTLTADTTAKPAAILLESMQRCGRRPGVTASVPALDFERVRMELGAAPETHVLLLLQALRHRITRVSTGSVRQAVVTAYARGDVLGVRGSCRSWSRLAAALTHTHHHNLLAQTAARFINALTAFGAGRSYLCSEEVCQVLLGALKVDDSDPTTTDMTLAALQKLSIRGEVQSTLIRNGAVEWLVSTLSNTSSLSPYTMEYAAALLMNLTLRSAGRARCVPLARNLLPTLTHLLASVPVHVVPYVTGALYSLLSHQSLRQEAFHLGLDTSLQHLAQNGSNEQRRQLEYIVEQIRRDPPLSPPPSPEPHLDIEEDPEWLEEELDQDDPVRPPPHTPAGEDLLTWRYTLHPGESRLPGDPRKEAAPTRSAPAPSVLWDPRGTPPQARPNSDGFVMRRNYIVQQQQHHDPSQAAAAAATAEGGQWDYPSDSDGGRSDRAVRARPPPEDPASRGESEWERSDAWARSGDMEEEVEEWALSLRQYGRPQGLSLRRASPPLSDALDFDTEACVSGRSSVGSPMRTAASGPGHVPAGPGDDRSPPYQTPRPLPRQPDEEDPEVARCPAAGATYLRASHHHDDHDDDDVSIVSTLVRPDHSVSLRDDAYQPTLPHAVNDRRNASSERADPEEPDGGGKGEGEGEERLPPEDIRYYDSGKETSGDAVSDRSERPLPTSYVPKEEESQEPTPGEVEETKTAEREESRAKEEVSPNEGRMEEKAVEPQEENTKPQLIPETVQPPPAPPPSEHPQERPAEERDPVVEKKLLPRRKSVSRVHIPPPPDMPKKVDVEASKLLEKIVGEVREMPVPISTPDNDPLLRSLPPPKVSEFKVAFSSRPKIARTPPGSAIPDGRSGRRGSICSLSPGSPPVLPPINRNNHTYTRAAT
ncbi:lisH domain-containing protein ARMC9-like isoform X2 [Penaeus japonicus]|uniref:lisH domain-containing protein ARMC9-like isoform X2 n=1 Tax=Penaeus japonicus TaxID=27405 RepID=UPI001C70DD61|nr:lisH domain-containing protein ARMC9-like isoform X2 [Penaeus japonicus]